jgi:hypothetical protein
MTHSVVDNQLDACRNQIIGRLEDIRRGGTDLKKVNPALTVAETEEALARFDQAWDDEPELRQPLAFELAGHCRLVRAPATVPQVDLNDQSH